MTSSCVSHFVQASYALAAHTCSSVRDDKWLAAAQESTLGEKWLMMARTLTSALVRRMADSLYWPSLVVYRRAVEEREKRCSKQLYRWWISIGLDNNLPPNKRWAKCRHSSKCPKLVSAIMSSIADMRLWNHMASLGNNEERMRKHSNLEDFKLIMKQNPWTAPNIM